MSTVRAKDPRRLKRVPLGGQKRSRQGSDSVASRAARAEESVSPSRPMPPVNRLAREQFARTFADVLSGRFGGRWSVEWKGADRPASPPDRHRRPLAREK
jgi:hypothetical protein